MILDDYRLTKVAFSANKKFRKKKPIPLNPLIGMAHKYNKKNRIIILSLKLVLNEKNAPFSFEIESESKFVIEGDPNKKMIEQLSTMNCPAIIFPYLRETIADLTRRAGYPPLHLPSINFVELAQTRKNKRLKT